LKYVDPVYEFPPRLNKEGLMILPKKKWGCEWLTDDEATVIVSALLETRGAQGATAEEICRVLSWAQHLRVCEAILHLALEGKLLLDIDERGEVIFIARDCIK